MTTLTSNDQPATRTTSAASLRIVQPNVDDRIVPLPIGKCTIGSSDRCQVHLTDAQVRPLHCLIVHEASGTLVTRWAPGALLNDQDFATAPFQAGDCLRIGEVQLVLVAEAIDSCESQEQPEPPSNSAASNAFAMSAPTASRSESANPGTAFQPPTTPDTPVVDPQEIHEADRLVGRLKTANDSARNRCRQLVGSLRTQRTEASSFDQKIDELQQQLSTALEEREQIFSQLSHLQGEAGERESQSSEEIDRLITELSAAYEKASVAEAELVENVQQAEQFQAELASLQGQREQWEQMRSSGELQRTKLSQALADREQAIETLQAEIEQSRETVSHAETSRAEQTTTLEGVQGELERLQSEREQLLASQEKSRRCQLEAEQLQADSEQNLAVFQLELEKFQITSRNTEQELGESRTALENLQAEFAPLAEERDQLVTKRTEYQLSEQGWEHELASRDSQIQELSDEIEQFRTTIDTANQDAASQVSQAENNQQELDALTVERDQLLAAQAEQVQKVQEREETVAIRNRRIKELEEEHVGICEMLQSVEKGAFEQVDSCNKLEKQLTSLRAERDELAGALPEQQEYVKQLGQALAERDGQITLLSDELTKTAQRQSELEAELLQGTSAYQALETELAESTTRCEQLVTGKSVTEQSKADVELTLVEYQGLIEELQQQIDTTQQQRQELEQAVASGSQSSEIVQIEFRELQSRHEQLTTDYRAETERRHGLDQKLAEREQNIELFQVDLKSVQGELDRTVEQMSSLKTERETLNQQLLGLREELASRDLAAENERGDGERGTEERGDDGGGEDGGGEDASVSQELLVQLEEEKTLLQQRVEQQGQQTEQLTAELEQARQALQVAEQTLQERTAEPLPVEEQAGDEPVAWPSGPQAESSGDVAEAEPHCDASSDTADNHDTYATEGAEETEGVADDATDGATDNTTADTEASAEASTEVDPTVSTSTAFDKQESEIDSQEHAEEFQPTSFIDQYQHMLDDSEETSLEPTQSEPESAPIENKLGEELDALGAGSEEESDEALQAYMSNMLRRMRGDENDDGSQPPQASSSTTLNQNSNPVAAVDEILDQVAPEREVVEQPNDNEPFDMEQLKRSSHKPMLPTDISAMRELANSSARRAIAKHHKRRHLEKALGLFLVCLIAICVGSYMLLSASSAQEFLGFNFLGGAASVLVGAFGIVKLLGLLLLAIREGAWEKKARVKTAVDQ